MISLLYGFGYDFFGLDMVLGIFFVLIWFRIDLGPGLGQW
jgi:hypothetical protein